MKTKIARALISVSDKTGVVEFAQNLAALDIEIISTGGTASLLKKEKIPFKLVSDITGFPEIMEGRVKTLHPKIHGGILGKRDEHAKEAKKHDIPWIDLVVVNLYPFRETLLSGKGHDEVIENIDIGGPAMLRAAAKNYAWVAVVTDSADYALLLDEIKRNKEVSLETRRRLAAKAFAHTAAYDADIAQYMNEDKFPPLLTLSFQREEILRYGENPHQEAALYEQSLKTGGLLNFDKLQGKALSYNNLVDAEAALSTVNEWDMPACVVVKHANPCGAALGRNIDEAFTRAWSADSKSAFGGIVALNRPCTAQIAEFLSAVFIEVILAPGYDEAALKALAKKPNCRVLTVKNEAREAALSLRFLDGALLVQDKDEKALSLANLKIVTQKRPSNYALEECFFAWQVVKHLKSNAILIVKDQATLGIGTGQVSRVDAVALALKKAHENLSAGATLEGAVLASDGFFPFRDNIDLLKGTGIHTIIQPGGSVRDEEVIAACDEAGLAMIFTGIRCFNH